MFNILFLFLTILACFSSSANETFDTLVQKSEKFSHAVMFPTADNRIRRIAANDNKKKPIIADQANATRPIMHSAVGQLIDDFLAYKKRSGTEIEKNVYRNLTKSDFIDRLLVKRPLMFMTKKDQFLLKDGTNGSGGFDQIGTVQEKVPFLLKDYLSYDEMQIAALLGVSTRTYFINDCSRENQGIAAPAGSFEESGYYVGLVGARFERPGLMEWQHMIVTPEQNTESNGYGTKNKSSRHELSNIWMKFYGEKFPTFAEASADVSGKYEKIDDKKYLNISVYKKRLKMVALPFLLDAEARGASLSRRVYCHVVGLGLGVWQVTAKQQRIMVDLYKEALQEYDLPHIDDVDFSWFSVPDVDQGIKSHGRSIKLHFSKRNPAQKLKGVDAAKLLVAQYAWDGNAYPGNEYWAGMLTASGDPSAASCSTIPELQNPLINSNVSSAKLFQASAVPYCVRLYCEKDVKTKIKSDKGHGAFFPAFFDKKSNTYSIPQQIYHSLLLSCRLSSEQKSMLGTDASKLETIAPWIVVKGADISTEGWQDQCTQMQRK